MKFETINSTDVVKTGDIQGNSVSIDAENIDFLITILSTNLYSKPIPSFVRETVSNAWDSHVEAGVTEPVILELSKDPSGEYFCRIQDFGVGLSEERFNTIYKNIGSSTKRGTNSQIGGFGIGRFSALAYSDVVYITSNYDGVQYKYMMYKDGNKLSIDLLDKQGTAERNGLEVKVFIKSYTDLLSFREAIEEQLVYFENLYLVDNTGDSDIADFVKSFNTFNIKKYSNFIVNNLSVSPKINLILGKVKYPLRLDSLNKTYSNTVLNYPITLPFDIGELEVTPNREEILYSNKNISIIESKLDKAIEEIKVLIQSFCSKDFTSVSEYVNFIEKPLYFKFMESDNSPYIRVSSSERLNFTLCGIEYEPSNFLSTYNTIMNFTTLRAFYRLTIINKRIEFTNTPISLNSIKSSFSQYCISDVSSLKPISKSYIRDFFTPGTYFLNLAKKDLRKYLRYYYSHLYSLARRGSVSIDMKAAKVILLDAINNMSKLAVFDDSKVPPSYIKQKKDEAARLRKLGKGQYINWKENVNLKVLKKGKLIPIISDSLTLPLAKVKELYKDNLVVYDVVGSEKLKELALLTMHLPKTVYVEVAPTRIKLLKNFPNFISLEEIEKNMYNYKMIRTLATGLLIDEKIPNIKALASIESLKYIHQETYNIIQELYKFHLKATMLYSKYDRRGSALVKEICDLCSDNNYYIYPIKSTLDKYADKINSLNFLLLLRNRSGDISDEMSNFITDYILAKKILRPDIKAILKLKKEKVYQHENY